MLRGEGAERLWVETTCALCKSWIVALHPDLARAARPALHRAHCRQALRDAAAGGAGRDRIGRPRVRGRFDPGGVRGDARALPRLQLQRVRAPRAALALRRDRRRVPRLPYLRIGLAALLVFVALKLGALGRRHISRPACRSRIIAASSAPPRRHPASCPMPAKEGSPRRSCAHRDQMRNVGPDRTTAAPNARRGRYLGAPAHVHDLRPRGLLRRSKNKHATAHFDASGHPIIRSLESGETLEVVLRGPGRLLRALKPTRSSRASPVIPSTADEARS